MKQNIITIVILATCSLVFAQYIPPVSTNETVMKNSTTKELSGPLAKVALEGNTIDGSSITIEPAQAPTVNSNVGLPTGADFRLLPDTAALYSPGWRQAWNKFYNQWEGTGDMTFRWLGIGDSLGGRTFQYLRDIVWKNTLMNRYEVGSGGIGSFPFSDQYVALGNSATYHEKTDYSLSISGGYYELDSSTSDNVIFSRSSVSPVRYHTDFAIDYVLENGGGTFQVEVSTDGKSSWSTLTASVDTDNASTEAFGTQKYTGIPTTEARWYRVTALTGMVKLLPFRYWRTDVPQFFGYSSAGIGSLDSGNFESSQVITDFITDYRPDFITWQFDDTAANNLNGLAKLKEWISGLNYTPGVLVMANGPKSGFDSTMTEARDVIADYCAKEGWMYFDQLAAMGGKGQDFAGTQEVGWGGDGTHLNSIGYRYTAHLIARMLGWPPIEFTVSNRPFDLDNWDTTDFPNNVQSLHVRTSNNATDQQAWSIATAGAGLDVDTYLNRVWRIRELDSDNYLAVLSDNMNLTVDGLYMTQRLKTPLSLTRDNGTPSNNDPRIVHGTNSRNFYGGMMGASLELVQESSDAFRGYLNVKEWGTSGTQGQAKVQTNRLDEPSVVSDDTVIPVEGNIISIAADAHGGPATDRSFTLSNLKPNMFYTLMKYQSHAVELKDGSTHSLMSGYNPTTVIAYLSADWTPSEHDTLLVYIKPLVSC